MRPVLLASMILLALLPSPVVASGPADAIPIQVTLQATPGNHTVTLQWQFLLGLVDSYKIYHWHLTDPEATAPFVIAGIGASSFTDTPLPNAETWCYKVQPVFAGTDGQKSNLACATPYATSSHFFVSITRVSSTTSLVGMSDQAACSASSVNKVTTVLCNPPSTQTDRGCINPAVTAQASSGTIWGNLTCAGPFPSPPLSTQHASTDGRPSATASAVGIWDYTFRCVGDFTQGVGTVICREPG